MGKCLGSKLSPLERLHARAAKIICKLGRETSLEQAVLRTVWMKLSFIYKKRIAIFMHDCHFNSTDAFLARLFEKDPSRSTRKNNLMITRPKKDIGRLSLRIRGPTVRNHLPDKLKSLQSRREHFKSMLKRQASYLNIFSLTKETTFNHNKDKGVIYYRLTQAKSLLKISFRRL